MAEEKQFKRIYHQGGFSTPAVDILVDRKTGVNYIFTASGYAGGLTVLLDRDGKPVISKLPIEE